MKPPLCALSLVVLMPFPALAFEAGPLFCRFQTECYDAEGCEETAYQLDLVADDTGGWIMQDEAEDIPATALDLDDGLVWIGRANGAIRMLSGIAGENARLSIHAAGGDFMLNYAGSCRADD